MSLPVIFTVLFCIFIAWLLWKAIVWGVILAALLGAGWLSYKFIFRNKKT